MAEKKTFLLLFLLLAASSSASAQDSIWDFILGGGGGGGQSQNRKVDKADNKVSDRDTPSRFFVHVERKKEAKKERKRVVVDLSYQMGCTEPGTFPVPGDCSRFLVCDLAPPGAPGPFRGTRFVCPTGTRFGHLNLYDSSSLLAFRLGVPLSNSLRRSPLHYGRCLYKEEVRCPWEDDEGRRRVKQPRSSSGLFSLLNLLP